MQKKFIALAVAGLVSGAAFAQTNVTVYGVVDIGYQYSKSDDLKFSGLADGGLSGSRIGFRATEALGNGLSVLANIELGLKADAFNGTSPLTNLRASTVGLSHANLGTVLLGRKYSPAAEYISKGFSSDVSVVYPSNTLQGEFATLNTSNRWDNGIFYTTPNWGGFEVKAAYAFGEVVKSTTGLSNAGTSVKGDTSDAGRFGVAARYNNGPVDVVAMYQMIQKNDSLKTDLTSQSLDDGNSGWSIGGSYDFKVVKAFASYQKETDKRAKGTVGTYSVDAKHGLVSKTTYAEQDFDKTLWSVGVTVPVTAAGKVIVEYVNFKVEDNMKTSAADQKSTGWGVGYEHAFSKRTTGYAAVSRITNNENSKFAFGGVGATDENNTNFGVGLRHTF